ncbi:MAG: YqgE/AlgH family protein [Nocardioides sp.]|uniref:YqgE/AlgH family protein n=1 Tax=Nocardioides sp. TaxID=35761 RepID=UPI003F092D88
MSSAEKRGTRPGPGTLLLATADLLDPNFADTVVLLLEVNDDGALGVVLNRPSGIDVVDVLESWRPCVGEPGVLFRGGPVSTDGVIGLGLLGEAEQAPLGWQPLVGNLGVVDLDAPGDLVMDALSQMRVYVGYAGWGADQLVREIEEGSWHVVASQPGDWFRADTSDLWREVMRRQPGMLAWHTTRPSDPDLN